jgi:hypothetical protein
MVSFLAVGVKFNRHTLRFDLCPAGGQQSLRTTVGRSRPGRAEDPAPSCATSGRAEIPGLKEFMVTRIQGFGNRAFAIGERYREHAVRASLHGRNAVAGRRSGRRPARTLAVENEKRQARAALDAATCGG